MNDDRSDIHELAALLVSELDEADLPDPNDIEAVLARCIDAGEAAWPQCRQPRAGFVRHLARILGQSEDPWPDRLEALFAADLYLAYAAAQGDATAAETIHRHYEADIRTALSRLGLTSTQVDEACQQLMTRTLVARPSQRSGIDGYAGRGALRSWLRSAAVRTGLKLARADGKARDSGDELLSTLPALGPDPELDLLKATYRVEFGAALRESLAALPRRDRTLLRQHFIDGLTTRELGALYDVHHATAARWLAGARETLFDDTRDALLARLNVAAGDLNSIIRLVRSGIDVSLHDLLATEKPGQS